MQTQPLSVQLCEYKWWKKTDVHSWMTLSEPGSSHNHVAWPTRPSENTGRPHLKRSFLFPFTKQETAIQWVMQLMRKACPVISRG